MPSASRPPSDPLLGQVLGDRFVVTRCLGRGASGRVYLAFHEGLGRPCAIKVLSPQGQRDELARRRFEREARIAAGLCHAGIVSIHDYGHSDAGEPFLAMEFVHGPTLEAFLGEHPSGALPAAMAVAIARGVAAALAYAHGQRVVHRDLKPQNVMLTGGALPVPKITDFGISRVLGEAPLTRTGLISGTMQYLAPEIWSQGTVAPAGDIYALGVMLFEMLCGGCPFEATDTLALCAAHLHAPPPRLRERRPDLRLPPSLDLLQQSLLAKDPALRPTAASAAQALAIVSLALPPASPAELQAAATMMLQPDEQGRLLGELRTEAPRPRPTGTLSQERERAGGALLEQAVVLARGLGPAVEPALRPARAELRAAEEALQRAADGAVALAETQPVSSGDTARVRLLAIRARLLEPGVGDEERRRLLSAQAEADRAYFLGREEAADAPAEDALRARRHEARCAFARAVLEAAARAGVADAVLLPLRSTLGRAEAR